MPNIIITGGGLGNKGAQAMTFICVDQIRKRWPGHKIFVQSSADWKLPEEVKAQYQFEIFPNFGMCAADWKSGGIPKLKRMLRGERPNMAKVDRIYGDAAAIIDVSGYIFGANWPDEQVMDFLSNLYYAKAYNIPIYLMPQSFGPFPFQGPKAKQIEKMAQSLLPGAKIIFAREQEGYDALVSTYGLKNVRLSMDMVLGSRNVNPENVFTGVHKVEVPQVNKGSVAIIPNSQNSVYGDGNALLALYQDVVAHLLQAGRKVYLMRHSSEDLKLCRSIQALFPDADDVVLLEKEYDCFEMGQLLPQFDFAIASRYHSVVHCYKVGTPCLVLGWAVKYHDLMQSFGQEKLFFDVRSTINAQDVLASVDLLNKNCEQERKHIAVQLEEYQKQDIFDWIQV